MRSFRLIVLTPRERAYDGEISSLVIPTADGEIGFLAGRAATVLELAEGALRFRDREGEEYRFETDGGLFRMTGEDATVLCGAAYRVEEAEEKRRERTAYLEQERARQEQSFAEYQMTRAALIRAFDKLKRGNRK